ncbi:MAG TPA: LysE family transporter [Clostridiaceae bacterium]|nr:LysE family transporter [Clostridiaceae bacterium]
MTLWGVFISAFMIGFSGAMMPGPLLGVAIDGSIKKGWTTGPLIVLGHGILELILVVAMTLGLKDFFSNATVSGFIGLFGGAFLAWMGYGMVRAGINKSISLDSQGAKNRTGMKNPALAGALVSATNPYFILWWTSAGMESVRQSYALGRVGVLCFFVGHILSDFVWYSAVSIALSRGKKLISDRVYHWVAFSLGVFMMAFSIYFMGSGLRMLQIY